MFVAGVLVWVALDGGWLRFALFFLAPDLSLAAYLAGPRLGAAIYNVAHSYILPAIVAVVAASVDHVPALLMGAIWTAHIGFDRVLGYGLKHPGSFGETHLGPIGAGRSQPVPRTARQTTERPGG